MIALSVNIGALMQLALSQRVRNGGADSKPKGEQICLDIHREHGYCRGAYCVDVRLNWRSEERKEGMTRNPIEFDGGVGAVNGVPVRKRGRFEDW